ncbi:MAG TPA: YraN family protein [Flexilinea sp.]|nr:YraN family protein [Flexilinea sp.]HOW06897.1 YraN family protein [Flexilinea sp.]
MQTNKIELGKIGESIALETAKRRGYQMVATNVRTPYGEIDLVLKTAHQLIFAEVKTRTSFSFGYPEQAINALKLSHMIQSAQFYMLQNNLRDEYRIDVISILYDSNKHQVANLEWIENVTASE